MSVAICSRSGLLLLVRMENSTGRPCGIRQSAVAAPFETVGGQQLARPFHRADRRGEAGIDPRLVARRYRAGQRHRLAQIDQADDGVAVDGGGNRLPETLAAQEGLVGRDLRRSSGGQVAQIEKQKAVFQAAAGVDQIVTAALAVFFQGGEVTRPHAADDVALPRLKAQHLIVFAAGEHELQLRSGTAVACRPDPPSSSRDCVPR